jgi:hypothetical protein
MGNIWEIYGKYMGNIERNIGHIWEIYGTFSMVRKNKT